jgi:excinuclease ABC subunit A
LSPKPRSAKATAVAAAPARPDIVLRGVRTHNLRNLDVDVPAGRLTVVTGVSGSGKSSLAFDTLFAEGQRRYVESLSTYARQFLARMPRPDADRIDHIPPAIALEQKNSVRNARSTVGTATEINDYLRILFARAGELWCPACRVRVRRDSPQEAARAAIAGCSGARAFVTAPVPVPTGVAPADVIAAHRREGFTRVWLEGAMADADEPDFAAPREATHVEMVVDRLAISADGRTRLSTAVETAYRIAAGRARVRTTDGRTMDFTDRLECGNCGRTFREPEPRTFNFNNPVGACPACQGFGRLTGIDWGKVIPNPRLSLEEGCIAPWNGETGEEMYQLLAKHSRRLKIPMKRAWEDLTEEQRAIVRDGDGDWPGVRGFFRWLEQQRYKVQARIMLARFRSYEPCTSCGGDRLAPDARAVRLGGKTFGELCAMPIADLAPWFMALALPEAIAEALERPLSALRSRLHYLVEVGLDYLTLDRATRTLSGGESQRINLATALGSALTETLYVLDEPTVGLHARDTDRLVGILKRLRDAGNTVVVVEHDLDVIREADWLLDIGPRAGEHGGRLVYAGPPGALKPGHPDSQTARFVGRGDAQQQAPRKRRRPTRHIEVLGARENNLRHLDVRLPLDCLCCVSGVSGSGKSTLIKKCLYGNYRRGKGDTDVEAGDITELRGTALVEDMVLIDQSPIQRSTRSNPATFLKAYDGIRELLSATPMAAEMNLTTRDFSFNVEGGRCEACEGTGRQTVEMLFLADVDVVCERCDGRRFQDHILRVEWNGMNVTRILDLTVAEALKAFVHHRRIVDCLAPMADVGLGYLRLGQSTSTLSGGEAQRLKIAAHLAEATRKANTLLLFDEPTTGLHPADLEVLLGVFDRLLDRGFSLIVIEHNLELLRRADWLVDMGPGGGRHGGLIVAQGTPEEVVLNPDSATGRFLAR